MPDSFATLYASIFNSKHASIIAALMESCPHPAQRLDTAPS